VEECRAMETAAGLEARADMEVGVVVAVWEVEWVETPGDSKTILLLPSQVLVMVVDLLVAVFLRKLTNTPDYFFVLLSRIV
jgi:hypothetical protein